MSSLIASGATCVKAGNGMVSTWTLAGSTTTYSGSYSTDGYNITAALTWVDPGTDFTTTYGGTNETSTSGAQVGMGTCVATLQTDGATELAASTTTEGNYALCHFIFFVSGSGTVTLVAAASSTNDWGQSNYLNETQWGTAGNGVKGNGMKATNSGGTIISATTQGHALTPAGASGTTPSGPTPTLPPLSAATTEVAPRPRRSRPTACPRDSSASPPMLPVVSSPRPPSPPSPVPPLLPPAPSPSVLLPLPSEQISSA